MSEFEKQKCSVAIEEAFIESKDLSLRALLFTYNVLQV